MQFIEKWYERRLEKQMRKRFESVSVSFDWFKQSFAIYGIGSWKFLLRWQKCYTVEEIIRYRISNQYPGAYWRDVLKRLQHEGKIYGKR